MKKNLTDAEREKIEKQFAEEAWLNYFNRYLFEQGTISQKEYMKMTEKIARHINKKFFIGKISRKNH